MRVWDLRLDMGDASWLFVAVNELPDNLRQDQREAFLESLLRLPAARYWEFWVRQRR